MKLMNLSLPLISMSEDCLFLNIYTPAHAHEGSSLPVSAKPLPPGGREHIASVRRSEGTGSAWAPLQCDPVEKPLTTGSKSVSYPE